MNTDILIRTTGRAAHITLNRAHALNALTWDMCLAIDAALDTWADAPDIDLLIIDAAGDKAFCSGGDIAEMYASGLRGDLDYGRRFWRDEYRMNAKLFNFPKPVVTFLQGFTMGGGVGVGCHGSHRIVCDTSQIAMPECSIGLVPDVGGSLLLAQAPGRMGEYLGVTGDRMGPGCAIHAGFADYYIPTGWDALKSALCDTGDYTLIDAAAQTPPTGRLTQAQADIDTYFGGERLGDIMRGMPEAPSDFLTAALKRMSRNAPLAMAVALQTIHRVRNRQNISYALEQEYRYTFRAMEQGDFLEGIRAAIIDKDRNPQWQHTDWTSVIGGDVVKMTLPLGPDTLTFEDTQ